MSDDQLTDEQRELVQIRLAAWNRERLRAMRSLAISCLVVTAIVSPLAMMAVSVKVGLQALLVLGALTWTAGCLWGEAAHPGSAFGRRAHRLMPLAFVPCLVCVVVAFVG